MTGQSPAELQSGIKCSGKRKKRELSLTVVEFKIASTDSVHADHTVAALLFGNTYNFRMAIREMASERKMVNGDLLPVVRNAEPPTFCSGKRITAVTRNGMAIDSTSSLARWVRGFSEVTTFLVELIKRISIHTLSTLQFHR